MKKIAPDNTLIVIPARGGSKGIPKKNIKTLGGKPLIHYAIDTARAFTDDKNIFVSTEDDEILSCANDHNLTIPFKRPPILATDSSGIYEVLINAVEQFEACGKKYDYLVLLQPTSPFRTKTHLTESIGLFEENLDMVVSVKHSDLNPYFNLFEENKSGYLELSKKTQIVRRQDSPDVYAYNGAIYIINIKSLFKTRLHEMAFIKKYVMDDFSSLDLDTPTDWIWAEFLLEKGLVKLS